MRVLDTEIHRALDEARAAGQAVYLLDLHTTSAGGGAFCVLEDTLPTRRFARALEAPLVLGLEEELSGTLTHWLAGRGVFTVGFEAGQHEDPAAVERAEAAVWLALEGIGCLPSGSRPEPTAARRRLAAERRDLPRVVEVRYRRPVAPEDGFVMAPGYANFSRVRKGQALAVDHAGAVTAPERGLLLMPLYQRQGEDGFFIVRKVAPVWLQPLRRAAPPAPRARHPPAPRRAPSPAVRRQLPGRPPRRPLPRPRPLPPSRLPPPRPRHGPLAGDDPPPPRRLAPAPRGMETTPDVRLYRTADLCIDLDRLQTSPQR